MGGRKSFYLLRHTQSQNNAKNAHDVRAGGVKTGRQPDPELSSIGVQQATHAACALSQTASHSDPTKRSAGLSILFRHLRASRRNTSSLACRITDVFVSPMRRTLCTAQPLKERLATASFHLHLDIFEEGGLFTGERNQEATVDEASVEHGESYDTLRGVLEFGDIVGMHGRKPACARAYVRARARAHTHTHTPCTRARAHSRGCSCA
jgi:broad specificity phosphatase PhoE